MRLRKNKLRLMMYMCGAAVVTLTLAVVANKIPNTFAQDAEDERFHPAAQTLDCTPVPFTDGQHPLPVPRHLQQEL